MLRPATVLLLVLLTFSGKPAFPQPDSIWSMQPGNQICNLLTWYHSSLINEDSLQVMEKLAAAEKRFIEKNSELCRRQVWLLRRVYLAGRISAGKRCADMLQAADEAAENNWPLTQAECWHHTGHFYYYEGKYVKAFEYMHKAQSVFERYISGPENYYLHHYANVLAGCYYHFGEYREAIKYFSKTIQLPPWWKNVISAPAIYNNLALTYQQVKQYDSAAYWFNRSYESAIALKDSFYMALAQGNLGFTYYLQQQFDQALPLLQADYTGSMKANQPGSATNAALTIAHIFIKKGEWQLAEKYIDLSRQYVYDHPSVALLKSWYGNLHELSKGKSDYKSSSLYADSLLMYQDSAAILRDKKAFNQAVLRLEAEKHLNDVSLLEQKQKQQILFRNSLLAVLALLVLVALLVISRQALKRKKEKELASQQLSFAQRELMNYTMQLEEKNRLVEQLREKSEQDNFLHDREGKLNSLLEATIITEEDWIKFRQLFEKVYPGFFVRLKEKMPGLSASDTRLLALTKLQLPPKNMATMLGVSYDAVKKARQRLRKKINLPEEGSLEELVDMIRN